MFKRRRLDDPTAPDNPTRNASDAALPAGLDSEEADEAGLGRADIVITTPGDTGLGVPPFRPALPKPALPKEAFLMSRPPFSSGATLQGSGVLSPVAAPRPSATAQPDPRPPAREAGERRTLVVGRGISVQGTVQDAERLVVEGTVEASMIHATELSISQGGMFKGEVEVEDAEVAGTFDGTLTARGNLVIRASGRVLGQARCRRLQVEDGGQISGQMEMLTESARHEPAIRAVPEHAD